MRTNTEISSGKKPHGILWWILVIAFFPISLSVWFYKSSKINIEKNFKIIILVVVWIILLIIGFLMPDSSTKEEKKNESSKVTVSASSNIEEKEEEKPEKAEETSSKETPSETVSSETVSSETATSEVQQTPAPEPQPQSIIVYIASSRDGEKYHCAGCRTIKKGSTQISLEDAKAQGYSACGVCHPPQ